MELMMTGRAVIQVFELSVCSFMKIGPLIIMAYWPNTSFSIVCNLYPFQ